MYTVTVAEYPTHQELYEAARLCQLNAEEVEREAKSWRDRQRYLIERAEREEQDWWDRKEPGDENG